MTPAPDPADIPVVILAGGRGMRLNEETERVPKPMVRLGEQPILWHIMRHYSAHGFRRFIICLGYKSWVVKEYFLNYGPQTHDLRVQLASGAVSHLGDPAVEDWDVTLAETGMENGSAGRLLAVQRYLDAPVFMYTYGDGVGDVDVSGQLAAHVADDSRSLTVTGVKAASRYGMLRHDQDRVTAFEEKPELMEGYINGGFFCVDTAVIDRMHDLPPENFFETDLLPQLAAAGLVGLHAHHGWWHSMDTYRDYVHLTDLWAAGDAPWKTWED